MSRQRLGQPFVSTGSVRNASSRSAADCIGRVGGLAAALGVGAVLFAAPWTAAADTDGSSGKRDSSTTSQSGATDSNDSSSGGQETGADDSDSGGDSGQADESEESEESEDDENSESSSEDEDLEVDVDEDLDEELDDADDDSSVEDDLDATDTGGTEFVDEDVVEESGGSDTPTPADTVAVRTVSAEPEPLRDPEPVELIKVSAPTPDPVLNTETAVVQANSPRSSRTSTSMMSARTADQVTEAPAKALQAQPGTFLEVASSMLTAVIAPLVASPTAPAAPSAQPLMWGVLSWVRRELEETFANFSISIGGRQIVQNGTAFATSEGFGSFAIAHGENAIASASGLFNVAVVRGDDSTATSAGNFTRVRVRGDDNTAGASGPGSRASVYGEQNSAEATGAYATIYVRGVGNEVTSTGVGARATVTGDDNTVALADEDGSARAGVLGDRNNATAVASDGTARISVLGHDNDATALATDGSHAHIVIRGDDNSGAASADEDSTARVRILGDGSTAVADADTDGYAAARITGDSNVASSDALGNTSIARITGDASAASGNATQARAEATTFGDGNAAEANDGKAVISGDSSSATADGPGSVARVWGDTSNATALGEDNTAFVWGDESIAIAGPGTDNTAISLGNNLIADTGPGDGNTVYGQPADPQNQDPVAGTPGEQTVDPETGTVTGTLGFSDPDGDDLTYTATDPANGSVTIDAETGTYTYIPATRPDFGEDDGADAFTVSASDGQATATTTINVPVAALPEPGNQAPQAGLSGPWQINEETGVVTATLGFTDPDGDPLTYEVTDQPDNGSVTVDNEAGTYTYIPDTRPAPGQPNGEDYFTVVASDPDGLTATNTIGLPIVALPQPGNQAPVTSPDSYSVDQDDVLTVGAPGVLGNDTDADSDALSAALGDGPDNGTLVLNPDGSFTYTPDSGYTGADSFTYTATDGSLVSTAATVTLTVNPVTTTPPNTVIGTVDVGEEPRGISVTPDGSRVYVVNSGNLFNEDNASVTVIDVTDPANPTVLQTIPFDIYAPGEIEVSPDGSRAYVAYDNTVDGNGHLLVIDTDPTSTTYNTVIGDSIEAGDGPTDIEFSPDGSRAIILNQSSLDMVVLDIDPASPTFHTLIGSPITVSNSSPRALAITPDGTRAYIAIPRSGANRVVVFDVDPSSAGYGTSIGAVIPVGDTPSDIAVSPDGLQVFVTNTFDDTVTVIDADPTSPTYNTTIGSPIVVGDSPQVVAFRPDGTRAYVSNAFDDTVTVIDTAPGSATFNTVIDEIAVGDIPREFAIDADGEHLYVVNARDETVSVVYLGAPSSSENQAPTAAPTFSAPDEDGAITGSLNAVDADGAFTYVPTQAARLAAFATSSADADSFTVEISDGTSPAITVTVDDLPILAGTPAVTDAIADVQRPLGVVVSPDGSLAYVTNGGTSDSLSVIDTATATVVATIPVGDKIREMAISPDGSRLYLTRTGPILDSIGTLVVFDTATRTITDTISVGYNPEGVAVSPDGTRVYVANVYGANVSVVDTVTNTVIATPGVGFGPARVAVSPDGTRVYASNNFGNSVSVIDTATNSAIGTAIDVGLSPFGVTVSPDGTRVYVANADSDSISVISTATNTVTATVDVDDFPTDVVFSPDGTLAYVTNYGDDSVSVVDTGTSAVVATVVLDYSFDDVTPTGVAFTPDGTRAYVTTYDDDTVSVISLVTTPDTPAVVGDDAVTVEQGSTANVIDVLANDSDADGTLIVTAVSEPLNGMVSIAADGLSVTYTPNTEFTGVNTFTYTVTDPRGGTGTGTVTVDVAGLVNQPPVAGTPGEQSVFLETGTVTGTLGITDPEGAFLDYTVDGGPSLGSVTIDFLGNYTYTPDPENRPTFGEEDGTDTFTVIATDPAGASADTTITVPVVAELNDENQAPVAGTPGPLTIDAATGEVSGSLDFFTDPDGDELTFSPIPGGYDAIALGPDGTFIYIPNTASRLRADGTQTMTVIATDPAGLSATAEIEIPIVQAQATVVDSIEGVGTFLTNIAASPDGSVVYVSNGGVTLGDSVSVIDPATNTVVDGITVGANPDGITFDAEGSTAYVVSADDGALVVIDTASGTVVDTIDLDNNNPREVAISPDGLRAYVAANDFSTSSGVLVVDLDPDSPTFHTVIEDFRLDEQGAGELGFNNYGDRLYVVTLRSVMVIDANPSSPAFNTVVDTIEIGDAVESIGIPTRGPFAYGAYVIDQSGNSIAVVDQSDDTVIDTVPVGTSPIDVAFSPDGSVAYVANLGDENGGTLTIIDVENHTVIDTLELGLAPASVAVSPDGTVYVANAFSGTVAVVDIVSPSIEP